VCGIAGWAATAERAPPREHLTRMTAAIAHRGPDDDGHEWTSTRDGAFHLGLGHRRLSIIDLGTGHQPMGNEDGSVRVVFNGEIYNFETLRDELIARGHVFRTASDTETIVHAYEEYGDACVEKFRGMFAFALWDAARERLLLARDPFGKKPLFVWEEDGLLLFASEIKALLAYPGLKRTVDTDAVWDYLAYRYVPGPATLLKGVRKLPPGCCARWERGRLREWRYYTPPDGAPHETVPLPRDPAGAFLAHLDEAVRVRMVSDVPFGAFLSGGIDSSAVVALMSQHSAHPVKTFSVGFADARYSELAYARTIAQQFGTEHHELEVTERELIDDLPKLVRYRDAPVAEPSDIPIYRLACAARHSVKMVLTGEGSDEFLGGYPKHVAERWLPWAGAVPAPLLRLLPALAGALPFGFRRLKTAAVNVALADPRERLPRWFGALAPAERAALVALAPPGPRPAGFPFTSSASVTALRRVLYFDQTSWLPDNLLERGDRMTMAASIEARMPFMDQYLAAFVSTLPDRYLVRGTRTKWILREAMARVLPRRILERPKVGFRVPVAEWFRGPMREFLCDHLTGPGALTRAYYHPAALARTLDEHLTGRHNHEKLLWSLLNLELWHREVLAP